MKLETKFDIGETVFAGRAEWVEERVQCPSCKGTGWWDIVAHSGEGGTWQATCQVCKDYRLWGNDRGKGTVKRSGRLPTVTQLTIGSIQLDTSDTDDTRYMCEETGVGSGTIYYEKSLFATREEAQAFADQEVQDQLPDALKKDLKLEGRNTWNELHHCTKPTRVQTRKDEVQKWCAWIQGEIEVTGHRTEKAALKALAEKLAGER